MSNVIPVLLGFGGFWVTGTETVEGKGGRWVLEVAVETVRGWSPCPGCGRECRRVRAYRVLRVRDIQTRLLDTVLVWRRRRFECIGCGRTHIETHPAIEGRFTAQYARFLTESVRKSNIWAVSKTSGVSWHAIQSLVNKQGERELLRRRALPCRVLLVDETSVGKGHNYMTVLYDGEKNHVAAMLPGRSKATLTRFFRDQGPAWRKGVEVVRADGSTPYKAAIEQYLPKAQHVLDRFHVVRWFGQSLIQLRRDLQRRAHGDRPPAWEPSLFRSRRLLLKRGDRLTEAEQEQLRALFDQYPPLETGWQALQELHHIYQAPNLEEAHQALARFADLYETGQIPQYRKTVNTILRWSDQILAFHTTGRATNAKIEAANKTLQLLRRTAHGFTNHQNYTPRGLLLT